MLADLVYPIVFLGALVCGQGIEKYNTSEVYFEGSYAIIIATQDSKLLDSSLQHCFEETLGPECIHVS